MSTEQRTDIRRQIGLLGFVFLWLLGFPLGGLRAPPRTEGEFISLSSFPPNLWKAELVENTWLHVHRAPNCFHRGMQRLCFGVRWYCLV